MIPHISKFPKPPKKVKQVRPKMSDIKIKEVAFLMLEKSSFETVIDFVIREVKNQKP